MNLDSRSTRLRLLWLCSVLTLMVSARSTAAQRKGNQVAVLVGAGDIADCADLSGAEATAKLLDQIPGTVFTAGDNAYEEGTAEQFAKCYGPTWGRERARTRPSVGNHEFHSGGATPYFDYFGAAAGDPSEGYYSYDLGEWHIIVLNSECAEVGGCQAGSMEEKWLRDDLKSHPSVCTLAYWHKPLFSSGAKHGNDPEIKPFWQDLYAAHTTLILNGHDHDYERFAPQDPDGKADPARGIREFVVGTGGKNHRPFANPLPTSEFRNADTFGVLKLTLHAKGYDWEFIPEAGKTFRDSGSGQCHGSTAASGTP
ncbi:MAG: metallophosphoesterase [Candidatus Acidiferrales bacterium]